jgi:UTP-glucose-1-phosphate uridylyltransferase
MVMRDSDRLPVRNGPICTTMSAATLSRSAECDPALAHKYGIVGKGEDAGRRLSASPRWWKSRLKGTAPSNYFINGRYILQPEIFDHPGQAGARRRQRDPGHRRDAEAG